MPNLTQSYSWAVTQCNAENVGYSETYRNQQVDPSTGATCYDCSSFIWYALQAGGFDLASAGSATAFTTSTMLPVLSSLGFVEQDISGQWMPGDIVWVESPSVQHTEMVYRSDAGTLMTGYTMGAHSDSVPLAEQVSINTFQTTPGYYTRLFRYPGGVGTTVSAYVIAAMCGCFKRESGVNPGIWESLTPTTWDHEYNYDGIGGYGLGQWTNVGTPYGRCYNLHTWVTSNGYSDGDGNGQLAFLVHENYWTASNSILGYATLSDFLSSTSTDIDTLTAEFLACWEGVPGNALAERQEAARAFYRYIDAHKTEPSSNWTWTSGNFYLGYLSNEQYANVMCAYWFLNGYVPPGPGPGPEPKKRKGIPIWMMIRYYNK